MDVLGTCSSAPGVLPVLLANPVLDIVAVNRNFSPKQQQ